MAEIDAVYFSCGRDRELLRMSLVSLLRHDVCSAIYVIGDPQDALTAGDARRLRRLSSRIKVINSSAPVERHGASGARAVAAAVDWYGRLLRTRSGTDFIVKLDSDTLVVGRRVFDFVAGAGAPAVGSPVRLDGLKFCRGACYFLNKEVVEALSRVTSAREFEAGIDLYLGEDGRVIAPDSYAHRYPEDRVIHTLIKLWTPYAHTMMDYVFDLEDASDETDLAPFDIIHFPGGAKALMPSMFERLVARVPVPAAGR